MLFAERKVEGKGYSYEVEDIFGTITMESPDKLDGPSLDLLVQYVMKMDAPEGSVRLEDSTGDITFNFDKKIEWEDVPEEKPILPDTPPTPPPGYRTVFNP